MPNISRDNDAEKYVKSRQQAGRICHRIKLLSVPALIDEGPKFALLILEQLARLVIFDLTNVFSNSVNQQHCIERTMFPASSTIFRRY